MAPIKPPGSAPRPSRPPSPAGRSRAWSSTGRWTRSSRTGSRRGWRGGAAGAAGARPLGPGGQAGGRLLRAGRGRGARRPRPEARQEPHRGARRPAADRPGDARIDAVDGLVLRVLVGPGARRRGAGRGEEAGRDAGRDVPGRARGGPRGARDPEPPRQAGRGAGGRLPVGRAAHGLRPLSPGEVRARADRGPAPARLPPHGQAPPPARRPNCRRPSRCPPCRSRA